MGRQVEALAQFVARTRSAYISAPIQKQAKLVFPDTPGMILAGSVRPEARQLRERLAHAARQLPEFLLESRVRRLLHQPMSATRVLARNVQELERGAHAAAR